MPTPPKYDALTPPAKGDTITMSQGRLQVPDHPIIPFIEGDGTGPDIWRASQVVFDGAVKKAYGGKRGIAWFEVYAGEKARDKLDSWLPDDTLRAISHHLVAIKGPLTTPVGGGFRSLNVALRQKLDLYACVRPVRWFTGVPSPVKQPELVDMIIFRENTEDIYACIEYKAKTDQAQKVVKFLIEQMGASTIRFPDTSGIGIKPISEEGSKRLIRSAIDYAVRHKKKSVTLVHKGNIMKFTEGAFRDWGYELARERFGTQTVAEADLKGDAGGKVVVKDRIADSMFQQVLLRPKEYAVLATPNLDGDFLSDACAAQVGGLGMAPGANVGDGYAVFEATHGTAPKYADLDKINPGSVVLSGVMMFEHLGWDDVAASIVTGLQGAISAKKVTYDLARQMDGATEVSTSTFADQIIGHLG